MDTLNEARRIKALDTGALQRERQRRVAAWYSHQTDGGRGINTFVTQLIVNELNQRGAL